MSIYRSMAKGTGWVAGIRLIYRGIGLISTIILARLLLPEDFGLVAIATALMAMLKAFSDFSVHVRIIQKDEIDKYDINSAWTLQLLLGVIQAVLLLVSANAIAEFYQEPRLLPVIQILAIVAFLKGLKNIGIVKYERELNFQKLFTLTVSKKFIGFVVTLWFAFKLQSYWALVYGILAAAIAELALSYFIHPYRPWFSTQRWKDLIGFSKWILLKNILNFFANRGPELILGKIIGTSGVGFFALSYEIGNLAKKELTGPVNRAALPGYSKLKKQEGGLSNGFIDVIGIITLVVLPVTLGVAAISPVLVPVLLGERWQETIPLIRNIALAGGFVLLTSNAGPIYNAVGKPQIGVYLAILRISLLFPAIFIGAQLAGVEGVTLAYLVVAGLMFLPNWMVIKSMLKFQSKQYVEVIYRPTIAAISMYFLISLVIHPYLSGISISVFLMLLIEVLSGALIYLVMILILWVIREKPDGAEKRLLSILKIKRKH